MSTFNNGCSNVFGMVGKMSLIVLKALILASICDGGCSCIHKHYGVISHEFHMNFYPLTKLLFY